jgi:hypothetical protein
MFRQLLPSAAVAHTNANLQCYCQKIRQILRIITSINFRTIIKTHIFCSPRILRFQLSVIVVSCRHLFHRITRCLVKRGKHNIRHYFLLCRFEAVSSVCRVTLSCDISGKCNGVMLNNSCFSIPRLTVTETCNRGCK